MAADDFLNSPDQGFPSDVDPSSVPTSGNRPASGARRATPGEVLSQGFHQGAQNAGDFLGLDTEFTASQDPNELLGGDPIDLVAPPTTYTGDEPAEPAPLPAGDPVQEFAQAPSAFEFGEDLGAEEGEGEFPEEGAPVDRKPVLVAALLVAGIVGGAVFYGPRLYSRYMGASVDVAEAPAPVTKPKPSSGEQPANPAPGKPATDAGLAAGPAPEAKPSTDTTPKEPKQPNTRPTGKPALGPTTARSTEPETKTTPDQPVEIASALPSEPAETATGVTPRVQASGFPDIDGVEYAWATEDQLELIWRGSEVPLDAVRAPIKTLMPRVGNVRVFTTSGDVFDGRLYAVGQDRVWVDAEPGRIGLDGERIERIEVLPPAPAGQLTSGKEVEAAGGKRVRVRVPGGMLYGRVLKAEGEEVILAMEDGGRVRVAASDLQELGSNRTVVVRR